MVRTNPRRASRSRCFPPARGDGPRSSWMSWWRRSFPPRSGGWSGVQRRRCYEGQVSPPLGGMVRGCEEEACWGGGFPPARGDGPDTSRSSVMRSRFPPRSGGWSVGCHVIRQAIAVSPPLGGMVRTHCSPWARSPCFPPARGDGPKCRSIAPCHRSFPPRSGGWSGWVWGLPDATSVSPPLGGMVRVKQKPGRIDCSFPPARGDGPGCGRVYESYSLFPPRSGGWSEERSQREWVFKVSPPLGGMVRERSFPPPL